jgi:hypothetical protein
METPAATLPVRKGLFRRRLPWRGALFMLAAFITFVALFLAEENWRGGRAWQNYKREMEAKGKRFDPERLIPAKVPDDQNLAMIPFLTTTNSDDGPMTGLRNQYVWPEKPQHPVAWRYGFAAELPGWAKAFHGPGADPVQAAATVFDFLQKHEPVLAELESVRQRPYCRYNINYEDWGNVAVVNATIPQFAKIKQLMQLLSLRAQAELVMGRTDQALDDINLMFHLSDGLKDEPFLISQLVRMASLSILLQPVGEGLAEQRWSEAQLRVLQEHLQGAGVMDAVTRALDGERDICVNQMLDRGGYFPAVFPRGWARLEQLNLNLAYSEAISGNIDLANRQINPGIDHSTDLVIEKFARTNIVHALLNHSMLVWQLLPSLSQALRKTAFSQNEMDLAMLACALERYRLAEGHYPEQLTALVPKFVATLPHDIINGQPLEYRRKDGGRFILYSVGWNEKDDGGVVAVNKSNHQDVLQGDWVWEYPETN